MKFFSYLLVLCMLMGSDVFGQTKQIRVSQDDEHYYQYLKVFEQKLKLPDLSQSKGVHWRLFFSYTITASVIIDVNYINDKECTAFATLYTQEYIDTARERPTKRVFSETTALSDTVAARLLKQLVAVNLNHIPTQMRDTIEGKNGFGVINVIYYTDSHPPAFEYADDGSCVFKMCWKKASNDAAHTVFDTFKNTYDLKGLTANFEKHIPFEQCTTGWAIHVKKETASDKVAYKKERDEYRKKNGL